MTGSAIMIPGRVEGKVKRVGETHCTRDDDRLISRGESRLRRMHVTVSPDSWLKPEVSTDHWM